MDQLTMTELAEKFPDLGQVACVQSDVWKEVLGAEFVAKHPELPFFLNPADVLGLQAQQGLPHGRLAAAVERFLADERAFSDRSEVVEMMKSAYRIMLASYFDNLPARLDERMRASLQDPKEQAPAAILALNLWSEDPRTDEAAWFLWLMAGSAFLRTSDYIRAAEYLRTAVGLNPKSTEALNELGLCYAVQQDYAKAEEQFHKALELAPEDFNSLAHLGAACLERGRKGEALTYLRRAIEKQPDNDKLAKLLKLAEALPN